MTPKYIYGHYDHGRDFVRLAKPPKASARQNGTSHCVVTVLQGEYAGESRPVPAHNLGVGLSRKLWGWFVRVGLIAIGLGLYVLITAGG